MSRFFQDTDSESESESSVDDEPQQVPKAAKPVHAKNIFQFSDEEEDTKRVVRSAKDKRYEELRGIIKNIKNQKKIKDMSKLLSSFEELTQAYIKAKRVVEAEGIPRFYIQCLSDLDLFINEQWEDREGRKTMSKQNSKGLSTLRQKLRKYLRDFESDIASYRENPEGEEKSDEEEEMVEASDSDEEHSASAAAFAKKKAEKAAQKKEAKSDDESDDSYWGSDSESSSSSDSEIDYDDPALLAKKFLKKKDDTGVKREGDEKERRKRERAERQAREKKEEEEEEEKNQEEGWTTVVGGMPLMKEKPKMFAKDAEITHEAVVKKLAEVMMARGKKGTDRTELVEMLADLRNIATQENSLGVALDVKILFALIASIFDYNAAVSSCLRPERWQKALDLIQELLDLLVNNPTMQVSDNIAEESEDVANPEHYRVRGCILTIVEKMDAEFTKMLQACDAHSTEYVERLKDEKLVCRLILRLQRYLEQDRRGTAPELCRIYLKRIEHTYYKFDHGPKPKTDKPEEDKEKTPTEDGVQEQKIQDDIKEEEEDEEPADVVMTRLCKYIYSKDVTEGAVEAGEKAVAAGGTTSGGIRPRESVFDDRMVEWVLCAWEMVAEFRKMHIYGTCWERRGLNARDAGCMRAIICVELPKNRCQCRQIRHFLCRA